MEVTTTVRLPEVLHKKFQDVVEKQYGKKHGGQKKAIEEAIRLWIENKEGCLMIVEDVYGKRRVESPDNITNLNLQEIEEIEPVSSRFNRKQISAIVELMRRFAAEKGHMLEITKIEMLDENKVLRKSVEVDPKDTNRIAELLSDYWTKKSLLPYGHIIAVIKTGKERIELTRQSLVILPASFL